MIEHLANESDATREPQLFRDHLRTLPHSENTDTLIAFAQASVLLTECSGG
jgi:hypothetical protein